MKLAEWEARYNVRAVRAETGYRVRVFKDSIPADGGPDNNAVWNLFHLSDYVVSASISGPAWALAERAP